MPGGRIAVSFQQNLPIHIHMISDGTGESVGTLVRAGSALFPDDSIKRHVWTLIRSKTHLNRVLVGIRSQPGPVFFSMLDLELSHTLQESCRELDVLCVDVMAQVVLALTCALRMAPSNQPGRQHRMDRSYFQRIAAIEFAVVHDDGQGIDTIDEADVVLVGASRVSKTPICLYLANRGIKAGNIPFVDYISLPEVLDRMSADRVIGLTIDPKRLTEIRRERVRGDHRIGAYHDLAAVREEIKAARELFRKKNWRVIEVTHRAIEETAASIIEMIGMSDYDG